MSLATTFSSDLSALLVSGLTDLSLVGVLLVAVDPEFVVPEGLLTVVVLINFGINELLVLFMMLVVELFT